MNPPDPQDVARTVTYLTRIADDTRYAELLADCIMWRPDPAGDLVAEEDAADHAAEQAAFRSEALVFRSEAAAKYLIETSKSHIRRRMDEATKAATRAEALDKLRATEHFLARVNMELRVLTQIAAGLRARTGLLPNAPNPRRRAESRLVDENLRGPVHKGRFYELVAEERAKDEQRRRNEKAERRRAAQDRKRAGRAVRA